MYYTTTGHWWRKKFYTGGGGGGKLFLWGGGGGGGSPSHPCSTAQLAMGDMFHDFKMFRLLFRTKFAHTLSLMIIQTDDARVK